MCGRKSKTDGYWVNRNSRFWGVVCSVGAVCACIAGVLFFTLFFFLMVLPETDKIERTNVESCRVTALDVHEYGCAQESGCTCTSSGCGAHPTCAARHSTPLWEGDCCDGSCCVRTCCQGCSRRSCSGSGKSRSCRSTYNSCCTRSCCEYSTEQCRVDWDSCWAFKISFVRLAAPRKSYPPADASCGFADRGCLAREMDRWAVHPSYSRSNANASIAGVANASVAGGAGDLKCWYDPNHDAVTFAPHKVDTLAGGWVGAGFGIGFSVLGALFALCALRACLVQRGCCKLQRGGVEQSVRPHIQLVDVTPSGENSIVDCDEEAVVSVATATVVEEGAAVSVTTATLVDEGATAALVPTATAVVVEVDYAADGRSAFPQAVPVESEAIRRQYE